MVIVTTSHQGLTSAHAFGRLGVVQVTAFTERNYGAGNETRTRDPDLGKIVPQAAQDNDNSPKPQVSLVVRNAQLIEQRCDAPSAGKPRVAA